MKRILTLSLLILAVLIKNPFLVFAAEETTVASEDCTIPDEDGEVSLSIDPVVACYEFAQEGYGGIPIREQILLTVEFEDGSKENYRYLTDEWNRYLGGAIDIFKVLDNGELTETTDDDYEVPSWSYRGIDTLKPGHYQVEFYSGSKEAVDSIKVVLDLNILLVDDFIDTFPVAIDGTGDKDFHLDEKGTAFYKISDYYGKDIRISFTKDNETDETLWSQYRVFVKHSDDTVECSGPIGLESNKDVTIKCGNFNTDIDDSEVYLGFYVSCPGNISISTVNNGTDSSSLSIAPVTVCYELAQDGYSGISIRKQIWLTVESEDGSKEYYRCGTDEWNNYLGGAVDIFKVTDNGYLVDTTDADYEVPNWSYRGIDTLKPGHYQVEFYSGAKEDADVIKEVLDLTVLSVSDFVETLPVAIDGVGNKDIHLGADGTAFYKVSDYFGKNIKVKFTKDNEADDCFWSQYRVFTKHTDGTVEYSGAIGLESDKDITIKCGDSNTNVDDADVYLGFYVTCPGNISISTGYSGIEVDGIKSSCSKVLLDWNAVNSADSYVIKRSDSKEYTIDDASVTDFTDTEVVVGNRYSYDIMAKRGGNIIAKVSTDSVVVSAQHGEEALKSSVPATCIKEGTNTYNCNVCGQITRTEAIDKLAHTIVTDAKVEPKCESEGLSEGSHCSVCGTVIEAQNTIPALGHSSDDGVVTRAATFDKKGVKTYSCTNCGIKLREEDIAKLNKTSLKKCNITLAYEAKEYNGKVLKPSVKVVINGYKVPSSYYSVKYSDNKMPGVATVTIKATDSHLSGTRTLTFCILPKSPKLTSVSADNKGINVRWGKIKNAEGYILYRDGKKIATIKDNNVDQYFDAKANNCKEYTYTVASFVKSGNKIVSSTLSGEKAIYYVTSPKDVRVKGKSSKSIEIKWNSNSKADGYQIQYSTNESMKSSKKVDIDKATTSKCVIGKLKKNTEYYVRVRAYKNVDGKKVYSDWSDVVAQSTLKK